jgi:hypothetical protein
LYRLSDAIGEIAELRRGRATTDEERSTVGVWQVEQMAVAARKSEGLVKSVRLVEAISEARRLHLRELEDKLTRELQAIPPEETELEAVRSTVPVSRVPLERYFRQYTRDRDWRVGLRKFAYTPPPTGDVQKLKAALEKRRRRPRIIDMISVVQLDEDRLPTWQPTTEAEQHEYRLAREASFLAAVDGNHLADILDRLLERYVDIPTDDVAAFVALDGRGNYELAAVFARALRHYWDGDLEACIHIAVPRIESAARLILRELDVAIYKVQLGERPGLYPQLGNLLGEFEGLGFDESWVYFLRWLLVERAGKNLRNQVAHGRVRGASRADAALVLRALLLLVRICGPGNEDTLGQGSQARVPNGSGRSLRKHVARPVEDPVPYPRQALVLVNSVLLRGHDALKRIGWRGR